MTKVGKIKSDKSWLSILSEQEQINLILAHPPLICLVDEEMKENVFENTFDDDLKKIELIKQDESLLQYADEDIEKMY